MVVGALLALSVFVGGFALVAVAGLTSATPTGCNLVVNSENVANTSVQSAINSASPGWKICLGAGSFPEQLTISTPGLKLVGAGAGLTFIDPPSVSATTVDWDSAPALYPLAAVILLDNVSGVTVQGLTVNATAASGSITGCGEQFNGIDVQNSSGTHLAQDRVIGVELGPSLLGCQNQQAIFAYTGYFATGWVPSSPEVITVTHVSVSSFGKNGITCHDPGLTCVLSSDTSTGIGPTTATAQNGIEIAYGAVGQLSHDHVSATDYTGGTTTLDWYGNGYQASGILLYLPGAGTFISHCTLSANAIAIADLTGQPTQVVGNSVSGSLGYGIVVNGAPGVGQLVANNSVNELGAGGVGILVDNGTFNVTDNTISHTSASGTNGASQVVCGTGSFLSCSPSQSVSTAAIQAVSESSVGATNVLLAGNIYHFDNLSVATQAVLGGSVALQFA